MRHRGETETATAAHVPWNSWRRAFRSHSRGGRVAPSHCRSKIVTVLHPPPTPLHWIPLMSLAVELPPDPDTAPPRRLWQVLGPGLITGAADDDPSGIATYSQVGAQF